MKVLLYCWGSVCEPGLVHAIRSVGDTCVAFTHPMKDYHADGEFAQVFLEILHSPEGKGADLVLSYDYFPLLSMLCEMNGIPYVSWLYDCPQYTLYSGTVTNACNYFFCFDLVQAQDLVRRGCNNVYSFPLGSDERMAAVWERQAGVAGMKYDITFLGSLYEQYAGQSDAPGISEYTRGYIKGLMGAQSRVYGYNIVKDSLTKDMVSELAAVWKLQMGAMYQAEPVQLVADAINRELSANERIQVLEVLGQTHEVALYSGSELPDRLQGTGVRLLGYADYATDMSRIFNTSRINLNQTVRTIASGIPQRVLDICMCGGFCLTNFQPEIAEYFTDGEELAMYGSMEELRDKAAFYLAHEDIRQRIARAGAERVRAEFSLSARWKTMKQLLFD